MTLEALLPVAMFALVATVTPGGATTLATASGAQFGVTRSLGLIVGIGLGLASLGAAAALGLASLILAYPATALALKLAGTAYLLWLAVRIARSGPPGEATAMTAPIGLLGGALLLWLNPKGWASALGAAAAFSEVADGPIELAVVMAGCFFAAAVLSLLLWSGAGTLLARLLSTPGQWRVVNGFLGLALALSIVQIW